jgi:hypothetical protein
LQQFQVFFLERPAAMVIGLPGNVALHGRELGGGDREGTVAILPFELAIAGGFMPQRDEAALMSRMIAVSECVAFNPMSRCTWSATPTMACGVAPAVRMAPPRKA